MVNKKKWRNILYKQYRTDKMLINLVIDYLESESIDWINISWKEALAIYRIGKFIEKYFMDSITLLVDDEKFFEEMMNELISIRKYIKVMHNYHKQFENDNRSGEETYGYKSIHSILECLVYISDRWRCQFRLRWLLDLSYRGKSLCT